jgi:hypothetical protein
MDHAMLYWRNRKRVRVLSAVIKHAGICQNTREAECFSTLFKCSDKYPAHSTADKFSISLIKYKSLRSFARIVGSYKAHATANQIVRNMLVIL